MQPSSFSKNKSGTLVKNGEANWAFVPAILPPNLEITWSLAKEISEADRRLAELSGTARTIPNPHLLIGPFSRREAVSSSKIEGTVASLSDLLSYEALGVVQPDKPDVREVANYVNALEYGLHRLDKLPISLRLIRELHDRLMRGVRGENLTPGEFRKRQNWIGAPGCLITDATFVPPPVPEMTASLASLESYIHSAHSLPPLVRMALIHYQFEAIHPFLDGNGRIGRLLITLLLCSEKLLPQPLLYLSTFFERHRTEYYRLLLEVSQSGNWIDWITFFLRGVAQQSSDAIMRATRLQQLSNQYRLSMLEARASGTLLKLVDDLFERPMVTASSVSASLKITPAAAQHNIDKLISAKIVREITGKQRNRIYLAAQIMEIVESEEPDQLSLQLGATKG